MDHKEAAEILLNLQKKQALTEREQEALYTAIGVLSWTALGKSRLKRLKEKHTKDQRR